MAITFSCQGCGKSYTAGDEFAGKKMRCKACQQVVSIPAAVAEEDIYGLDEAEVAAPPPPRAVDPPIRAGGWKPATTPARAEKPRKKFFSGGLGAGFVVVLLCGRVLMAVSRFNRNKANNDNGVAAAPGNPGAFGPSGGYRARPRLAPTPVALPPLPEGRQIEPGVTFHEVRLGTDTATPTVPGHRGKLWVYLPEGAMAPASVPCVFTCGAGSKLIFGMDLGDGDRPEHLPYARAGFTVVAYELDGAEPEGVTADGPIAEASMSFLAAEAGLVNARNAIAFTLEKLPQVDPNRLCIAGHSSAGTMALLLAENEPRLRGVAAYAPRVDTEANAPPPARQALKQLVPGASAFWDKYNPSRQEARLNCPVFLFHAQGDAIIPSAEITGCADRLRGLGKVVTLETVPGGDHYQSMIEVGQPRGIAWLAGLAGLEAKPTEPPPTGPPAGLGPREFGPLTVPRRGPVIPRPPIWGLGRMPGRPGGA